MPLGASPGRTLTCSVKQAGVAHEVGCIWVAGSPLSLRLSSTCMCV